MVIAASGMPCASTSTLSPGLGRLISHPLPAGERDWFTEGLDVILDVSAQPTISEAHQ
ncbi:hypothetical protein [Nonomuraea sp. bgisy101]|uniref:hypothetical protein n=1 Tax=Nonomuraea sp. bgisy101 TaxID=3413784 RepID=UPI003D70B71F